MARGRGERYVAEACWLELVKDTGWHATSARRDVRTREELPAAIAELRGLYADRRDFEISCYVLDLADGRKRTLRSEHPTDPSVAVERVRELRDALHNRQLDDGEPF